MKTSKLLKNRKVIYLHLLLPRGEKVGMRVTQYLFLSPLTATLLTLIGKRPYVPFFTALGTYAPKNPNRQNSKRPFPSRGEGFKDANEARI